MKGTMGPWDDETMAKPPPIVLSSIVYRLFSKQSNGGLARAETDKKGRSPGTGDGSG